MNTVKIIREVMKGYFGTYPLKSPNSFTIDIDSKNKVIIFYTDSDSLNIRVEVSQFPKGINLVELIKKTDNAITNLLKSKRIVSENEIIKVIKEMV